MTGMEQDAIIERLEEIVLRLAPDSVMVRKYGGRLYSVRPDEAEGQFCGIFPYKAHVQLAFSHGAMLDDPKRILAGSGKFRRHVNIKDFQDIDAEALGTLIGAAVQHSLGAG